MTEDSREGLDLNLLEEEPLSIRVQGKPYSVVMRTPGDELALVAGFCLTEGIVDAPDEFTNIAYCDGSDTNVVTVTLTPSRRDAVRRLLDRQGFVSQSSCGICGKTIIEDLHQIVHPIKGDTALAVNTACTYLTTLSDHQVYREHTRASHAAAIYDAHQSLLTVGEDVGRHNALDKAIGKLFLDEEIFRAAVLVLSSRISYELVQKAARARIPIVLAKSRPTVLALELAEKLNMTIASAFGSSGLYVYCGADRLID
ncbi:Sulfur carrier protein FdhD [Olavius algarvensis associated proteobacterium Delta 3]|nr:Sulfur carrier protein FdhD [Olavius algarvensis associated proteobacterium Delta 3]